MYRELVDRASLAAKIKSHVKNMKKRAFSDIIELEEEMENSLEDQPLVIEEVKFGPTAVLENGAEICQQQMASDAVIEEKTPCLKSHLLWGSPGRLGAGFFESSTGLVKKEHKKPLSLAEYKWRNRYSAKRSSSDNVQMTTEQFKEDEKQSSRSSSAEKKELCSKLKPGPVWKDRIKSILNSGFQRAASDRHIVKNGSASNPKLSSVQLNITHSKSNTSLKSKSFATENRNLGLIDAGTQFNSQFEQMPNIETAEKQSCDSSSEDELFEKGGISRRSSVQDNPVKEPELKAQPTAQKNQI